ncbi:MAG: tetratricopeptide repeat protein [Verrucomicrobiota bacterium]
MKDEHYLAAASGYYDLGMMEEALQELTHLPESKQNEPEVMMLETAIRIKAGDWKEGYTLAEKLSLQMPKHPAPWLDMAFCLHEMGKTQEALDCLLTGPEALKKEAIYFYNLACYEARLGSLKEAREHLDSAISLQSEFLKYSRKDPDLAPLYQTQ